MQLAPDHERRVAIEGRRRRGCQAAILVLVSEDELAGLDRPPAHGNERPRRTLVRDALPADVLAGDPFDRRLRKAVGEAEVLALGAEQARLLHMREAQAVVAAVEGALPALPLLGEVALALRVDDEQHLELAQVVVPPGGLVAEPIGARRHAGAELVGKAIEDRRGEAELLQAAERERDVQRRARVRGPLLLGGHRIGHGGQKHARGDRVDDAREEVPGEAEALAVAAHDAALQIGDVDHRASHAACSAASFRPAVSAAKRASRSRSASASPTSSTVACGEPTTENPTPTSRARAQRTTAAASSAPGQNAQWLSTDSSSRAAATSQGSTGPSWSAASSR